MRKVIIIGVVIAFIMPVGKLRAEAEDVVTVEKVSNLQLSLFPPIQLADVDTTIKGFRLGIFPMNHKMQGLDIGLLNWTTDELGAVEFGFVNVVGGDAVGVQFGTVNIDCKDMVGWKSGGYNGTLGDFVGLQSGILNITGGATGGVQFGTVNYSSSMTGLQLGLLNITGTLCGIQLGIINIAGNGFLPVFPIINAAF